MLFHSVEYAFLLILVWVLAWTLLRGRTRGRHLLLLGASYVFYCSWDWRFASLLIFSTVLDFVVGGAIHRSDSRSTRRLLLWISLAGNLGVLGFFKYYNFFLDNLNLLLMGSGLGAVPGSVEVILPLGISFYTFQTLSYSLDIYQKKLEPTSSLLDFALFVSFFPQLIAGPIVRARQFLPQLETPPVFDETRMVSGTYRILKGLVKKVFIADLIGLHIVDPVFADPGAASGIDATLAALGFYMQLGFDFSGYADIAIGSARLLGFELPENFRAAARAVNLGEFWRRWHITLFTWVRDYFYIPWTVQVSNKSRLRPYVTIFLTMLLIGLWHGASWTFVLFGMIHGSGLAATRLYARATRGRQSRSGPIWTKVSQWGRRLMTLGFVSLSIVIFRAASLDQAWQVYAAMVSPSKWALASTAARVGVGLLVMAFVLHLTTLRFRDRVEQVFIGLPAPLQGAIVIFSIALVNMAMAIQRPFVYFQF